MENLKLFLYVTQLKLPSDWWRYIFKGRIMRDLDKYILLVFFALFSGYLSTDCGCEDKALIHVTYIDAKTNKEMKVWLQGYWWSIHASKTPYSNDLKENKKIESLSLEEKLNLRFKPKKRTHKWGGFTIVKMYSTPVINTKNDGKIKFNFINHSNRITSKNIKKIVKVHNIQVGCAAWP